MLVDVVEEFGAEDVPDDRGCLQELHHLDHGRVLELRDPLCSTVYSLLDPDLVLLEEKVGQLQAGPIIHSHAVAELA